MSPSSDIVQGLLEQVRQEQVRQGITRTELARRAGMHATTVSDALNGRYHKPTLGTVCRLAGALGMRVHAELVRGAPHQ